VPLAAGKQSVVAVEEREPRRRTVTILDARGEELGLYVEGGGLPPEIEKKLGEAIAVRRQMGAVEAEIAGLRERLADASARSAEVRDSLRAIEKVKGADDLRRQLLARLAKTTALSDELARGVGEKAEALAAARARVEEALRDVSLDEPTP